MNAERYDKHLNAFITLFKGQEGIALARARALASRGDGGPLHGVPLAIKDNMFFGGFPTTAASYYFREYVPSYNSGLVDRALGLGSVPLGKTNLHELALGATSAGSYFGPVRNPRDRSRVSGGSSGGSAVAVAMSIGPVLGLGTDTGGSIRVPASLCGIMGFKPSHGALSLSGVFPLSATLDHAGLLTRTMPDMVLAFALLSGREGRSAKRPKRRRIKVGVMSGHFFDEVDRTVERDFWVAMNRMEGSGAFEVEEVQIDPSFQRFTAARAAIQLREAGWFYEELATKDSISSKMNADVVTLLRRGLSVSEPHYLAANLIRLESIQVFGRLLEERDLLAMPTTRVAAPKLDEVLGNEAGNLRKLLLSNTEAFNLNGFPALSIPANPRSSGLPTGLQLAGRLGDDRLVLRAGELAERAIAG
jgi:aspartyl-tRNA(Asn)/glutamyl-tRNA(Gln) amidotransferase subunit A